MKEKKILTAKIETATQTEIDLFDFKENDVSPYDIVSGLSKCCRFAGQINRFYSVAEHSYYVALMLPNRMAIYGLLHDCSEAFFGDWTKPFKDVLFEQWPELKDYIMSMEETIFKKFGLNMHYYQKSVHKEVKACEKILFEWEYLVFKKGFTRTTPPFESKFPIGWTDEQAFEIFLNALHELTGNTVA